MCICRLTLAWISSEISTKLLVMPTYLDWSSLTGLHPLSCRLISLLSGVDWPLASPFVNCLLRVPLSNTYDMCSLHTSGHVKISGSNPLSGFALKQTKGSSTWRTTYIVLQSAFIPIRRPMTLRSPHRIHWYSLYLIASKRSSILS